MKKHLLLWVTAALLTAATGCSKCKNCTKPTWQTLRICLSDFNGNQQQMDSMINRQEKVFGYVCEH
ncbi:MAG: hypothetical protein U0T84_12835 [Chitinophagales bacterium]